MAESAVARVDDEKRIVLSWRDKAIESEIICIGRRKDPNLLLN